MTKGKAWSALRVCRNNKKIFLFTACISILISCFISWSTPNTYISYTKLSIDSNDKNPLKKWTPSGIIGNRIELPQSNVTTEPFVYLEIIESPSFIDEIGKIPVKVETKHHSTTFLNYLIKDQHKPWWSFLYEETADDIIRSHVKYEVDMHYGIITIQVSAQHAEIAHAMVDSVTYHLQEYMSRYMVNKAEVYFQNVRKELDDAHNQYREALHRMNSYADSHTDLSLPSTQTEYLKLKMHRKRTLRQYDEAAQKYRAAQMMLQRVRPTFYKVIKSSRPQAPTHPRWIVNILIGLFFALLFTTWYVLYHHQYIMYKTKKKNSFA